MSKINKDSDITEIAAIVSDTLEKAGVGAVLCGGAWIDLYNTERPHSAHGGRTPTRATGLSNLWI